MYKFAQGAEAVADEALRPRCVGPDRDGFWRLSKGGKTATRPSALREAPTASST